MARIRTVKPNLFKNEELAELPATARLLFIGLFCIADKEGRLEDRPKRIKAEVFPYDNVDVDDLLSRLQSAGFIVRYSSNADTEFGEMKVIQVVNFTKHQRISGTESQTESELPSLPKRKQQGSTEEALKKHSGLQERKGRERKGKDSGEYFIAPDLESVREYFKEKGYSDESAKKAFEYYDTAEWRDSKGNKVKNWKQKMISVWFKEENKNTVLPVKNSMPGNKW